MGHDHGFLQEARAERGTSAGSCKRRAACGTCIQLISRGAGLGVVRGNSGDARAEPYARRCRGASRLAGRLRPWQACARTSLFSPALVRFLGAGPQMPTEPRRVIQ